LYPGINGAASTSTFGAKAGSSGVSLADSANTGGVYGGGAGGNDASSTGTGDVGGQGALRIIWPGTRTFPYMAGK
jgi:hypothetical protein